MISSQPSFKFLLLITAFALCTQIGLTNPIQDNDNELGDLNTASQNSDSSAEDTKSKSSSFSHYDEDQDKATINLAMEPNLKYDVEILEVRDIKKENVEVEERFRGPAIEMNTDTFVAENIEVDNEDTQKLTEQSHLVLTWILIGVAAVSVGLYAVLVIWRAQLEQRYGMRELLVTTDDDFCQANNNRNNNNNNSRFVVRMDQGEA